MPDLNRLAFDAKRLTVIRSSDRQFREYVHNETLDPQDLRRRQLASAMAMARFAMTHTDFYRQLYGHAGITLADLHDPAVFEHLPIVEKAHVRENFSRMTSTEATDRNSAVSVTGGTTGQPLRLRRDLRVPHRALPWRLYRWWGVRPWDNSAIVARHVRTARAARIHAAQWWPTRHIQLDAFRINRAAVENFLRQWEATRPRLLIGYAGGILELARTVRQLSADITSPVAIATTAAPLTPAARAEIETALGAPVYDHYRSSEIPWMGGESSAHDGIHIFADARVIETVDETDVPVVGRPGHVVATDLTNRVFPMIRYRLGDRTTILPGVSSSGITLPRIAPVTGRSGDGIRLPDGSWISWEGLYQVFSKRPNAVRQFQLHQRADYSILLRCIPGEASDALPNIEAVVGDIRALVGDQVPVTWEQVDDIEHEGGKIRYIRSDVTNPGAA